jgi:hypothetical protein
MIMCFHRGALQPLRCCEGTLYVAAVLGAVVFGGHPLAVLAILMVWGASVIADSGLFSACTTEIVDRRYAGTTPIRRLRSASCSPSSRSGLPLAHRPRRLAGRGGRARHRRRPGAIWMVRLQRHMTALRIAQPDTTTEVKMA